MNLAACGNGMKLIGFAAVMLIAGCAASGPGASPDPKVDEYKAEIGRLKARLAVEVAERQRIQRAALRREETLRRQLDAMKSIERDILERDDRQTETR
jgi:hypothetical protein